MALIKLTHESLRAWFDSHPEVYKTGDDVQPDGYRETGHLENLFCGYDFGCYFERTSRNLPPGFVAEALGRPKAARAPGIQGE